MQEKRRGTERRYDAIVANAPLFIHEVDLEGRLVTMNPVGLEMLGLNDVCEISGKPLVEYAAEEDRGRLESLLAAASSGDSRELEIHFRTKRGNRLFRYRLMPLVADDGRSEALLGIAQDVTEPRTHEKQLRVEHEYRKELFRTAQAIVLILDPGGRIIEFNPFMEQLTGYQTDEVRGKDWFTMFLPERDRTRIREIFERAVGGTRTRGTVNQILTRDGRELDIEWYSSILTEENGAIRAVLGIGHDVTERRRSESLLRESEHKLRELSGKLLTAQEEDRRRLSRELHDDLGQRLAIVGMELAQLQVKLRGASATEASRRSVERLIRTVDDLAVRMRDMSHRLHPSAVEHLGLAVALRRECDVLANASGKVIDVVVDEAMPRHPPESATMCLFRVAQEAIRNAVSHSGSERIEVRLVLVEDGIRLSVEDWGRGFDRNVGPTGRGLGLVSMEERARLAQGKLEVDSRPGRGTVVSCSVPSLEDADER